MGQIKIPEIGELGNSSREKKGAKKRRLVKGGVIVPPLVRSPPKKKLKEVDVPRLLFYLVNASDFFGLEEAAGVEVVVPSVSPARPSQ